jgi:energy-converting hydrogenase Eha subunit A
MCAVTVAASSTVFHVTGGVSSSLELLVSPLNAVPLLLAALTYFAVNTGLVAGVVALRTSQPAWNVWRTSFAFPYEMIGAVVLNLLGYLFAILFLTWGYMSAFLAVIATYFIRDAYMRYVSQDQAPVGGRPGDAPGSAS